MQSAFLWLSMAIGLAGARRRSARRPRAFAPPGWLQMLLVARVHPVARRSAWTRAMDELALVPARPRRAARGAGPDAGAR